MRVHHPAKTSDIEQNRRTAATPAPRLAASVYRYAVGNVLRSPGQPLAAPRQEEMAARLGADFSRVRVHTDSAARASAIEVGGRAFAVGPEPAGKHTGAHELTQVIQQHRGPVNGNGNGNGLNISSPGDHLEHQAETNGRHALSGPRPVASPAVSGAGSVLAGPRAVGHRVATGLVQAKLGVGPAGDRCEQEAGRIASEVTRDLRSEPVEPVSEENAVQLQAHDAEPAAVPPARRQIQAKAAGPVIGLEGGELDTDTDTAIRKAKGKGKPLGQRVRRSMEAGFGADFSGVRVHTDAGADDLNQRIQAKAFTSGSDIFFGKGLYNPSSTAGQELLAHELTHTLQQGATMGSLANIQRADDTGLKKEAAIETFSKKVKARTTGGKNPLGSVKEWGGLNADARAAKLTKYVNAELVRTHVPEVGYELDARPVGEGSFNYRTWKLTIGSTGLAGNMTDDEIAELADTFYHESRHTEQWFRIARLKAGDSPQPTSAALAASLFILPRIAEAALDRPLKPLTDLQKWFHSKGYVDRQQVKMAEAQSWYQQIYGTGGAHRAAVLNDINNRHAEYLLLSEEVDAWDVGGKARTKVRQLIDDLRVKQTAAAAARAPAASTP